MCSILEELKIANGIVVQRVRQTMEIMRHGWDTSFNILKITLKN